MTARRMPYRTGASTAATPPLGGAHCAGSGCDHDPDARSGAAGAGGLPQHGRRARAGRHERVWSAAARHAIRAAVA